MEKTEIATPASHQDWKRIVPGLAISLITLAVVFYFANPARLWSALQHANYGLVLANLVISVGWLGARAWLWRTLLQEQATYDQVFFTVNEGYLLNNILPFRLGEVARAFLMSRKASLSFFQVFSTILIERALDLGFAAGLLLATLSFVVGGNWARPAALAAGGLVLAGLVGLFLLARNRAWAETQANRLAQRWPKLQRFAGRQISAFFEGLAALNQTSRFARVVLIMLLNWSVALAQYYILMLAFFPQAQFLWAAFSLGVAAMGLAAPAAPGSIGTLEGAIMLALSSFKVDPSTALAFALTVHLMNYITTGLFGSIGLARDGETLTGLFQRVRHIPQGEV